jgi:amino acid permease
MRTGRDGTKLSADVRSIIETVFGALTFCALVYVAAHRFAASTSAAEVLFWVHYSVVRVLLSGLMVYSGMKSSSKNPHALFGLNMGIGLSSLFLCIMNILEVTLAKGDWKDVAAAVLYLPVGLVVIYTTLYLRRKQRGGGDSLVGN